MRVLKFGLSVFVFFVFCFANLNAEPLQFKAKIGFVNSEDTIQEHRFFDNGKKLLLIGQKSVQLWDVENAKLLNSFQHSIPQFASKGFLNKALLRLPEMFSWKPFFIDPFGKYLVTVENQNGAKFSSSVVRDLETSKQLVVLQLPDSISTEYINFDPKKNELITFGKTDKNFAIANWNSETFELKKVVLINDYKWHQFIENEEKMIVGSGDTATSWNIWDSKQGGNLSLRDTKTGKVEKEYTAYNLIPKTAFQETTISKDERFLISERNNRVFVWEIAGNGLPKFEVSAKTPKEEFKFGEIVGNRFIIVSADGKLLIYDAEGSGKPKIEIEPKSIKANVKLESVAKDGRFIVVSNDIKLSVFDLEGNEKPIYELVKTSDSEAFTTVGFMDKEKYLVVGRVNRKEKQPEKTEFYEIETGKLSFEIPAGVGETFRFVADGKYLFSESLGGAYFWNFAEKKSQFVVLRTYSPSYDPENPIPAIIEEERNTESIKISPNGELILRFGEDVVSVIETSSAKAVQILFDSKNVKYDKKNKVKKSGLKDVGWLANGKYVYAFDENGYWQNRQTVSLWEVK